MPISRGGAELVGTALGSLEFDGWIGDRLPLKRASGATVLRWWTEGCPFCEASLPALDELRREYEALGLQVIAVYHQKSADTLSDAEVSSAARERHFDGPVALDREGRTLDRAWPAALRSATSVTLLLDADGAVGSIPRATPTTRTARPTTRISSVRSGSCSRSRARPADERRFCADVRARSRPSDRVQRARRFAGHDRGGAALPRRVRPRLRAVLLAHEEVHTGAVLKWTYRPCALGGGT
jgi:thiol-disulfide isomerase/thioredoxin